MSRKLLKYLKDPCDNIIIDIAELEKFTSLRALMIHFRDKQVSRAFLEEQRWHGKPQCPYCGAAGSYRTDRGFKCRNAGCYQKFSVTVGTIYENTKAPLRVWFAAIYLAREKISSGAIAKKIGVSQKTAWSILNKLRTTPTIPIPKQKKETKKAPEPMSKNIDKDQLFNETRRLYLTKLIGSDIMLKRMREAGETLALISDEEGRWACASLAWARYVHKETGSTLEMWIPARYWKDSPRNAAVYTLNRLHKERNNLMFGEDEEGEKE